MAKLPIARLHISVEAEHAVAGLSKMRSAMAIIEMAHAEMAEVAHRTREQLTVAIDALTKAWEPGDEAD